MDHQQIEAIRRRRFVVETFWPETRRFHTAAFATDLQAVWFMERAVHQGARILECTPPCAVPGQAA